MLLWVVRCSHALLCTPPHGMACLLVSWESKRRANSPRKKVTGRESGALFDAERFIESDASNPFEDAQLALVALEWLTEDEKALSD